MKRREFLLSTLAVGAMSAALGKEGAQDAKGAAGPPNVAPRKYAAATPEAAAILKSSDVWDMTIPWTPIQRDLETLRRYKRSGYTYVSLTTQDWGPTYEGTLESIRSFKEIAKGQSDWLVYGGSIAEIEKGRRDGKLVFGFNSQETLPIGMDLSRLETLHKAGVRHMLLAYQVRNFVADGCAEAGNAGLSNYGKLVVKEMNRVGMVVDCSHTGRRSTLEAIELTEHPPIFSHSGAYAVTAHIRNIHDDQIKACAAKGGVIGIFGLGYFIGDLQARTETYFRHIDHIVQLVGPQHVGIGSDYLAPVFFDKEASKRLFEKSGSKPWPDGRIAWLDPTGTQLPMGEGTGFQPEQLAELVGMMLAKGYKADAIKGILGSNFKRVYAAAVV